MQSLALLVDLLARIPEKWQPVFREGYAPTHESGAHSIP
jgi:hypothetical protein